MPTKQCTAKGPPGFTATQRAMRDLKRQCKCLKCAVIKFHGMIGRNDTVAVARIIETRPELADMPSTGGEMYGCALEAAIHRGRPDVCKLLIKNDCGLSNNISLNKPRWGNTGPRCGPAFQAALVISPACAMPFFETADLAWTTGDSDAPQWTVYHHLACANSEKLRCEPKLYTELLDGIARRREAGSPVGDINKNTCVWSGDSTALRYALVNNKPPELVRGLIQHGANAFLCKFAPWDNYRPAVKIVHQACRRAVRAPDHARITVASLVRQFGKTPDNTSPHVSKIGCMFVWKHIMQYVGGQDDYTQRWEDFQEWEKDLAYRALKA